MMAPAGEAGRKCCIDGIFHFVLDANGNGVNPTEQDFKTFADMRSQIHRLTIDTLKQEGLEKPLIIESGCMYEWSLAYQCYYRTDLVKIPVEYGGDCIVDLSPQEYNQKYNQKLWQDSDHPPPKFLYRALRDDEDVRYGLLAKRPDANKVSEDDVKQGRLTNHWGPGSLPSMGAHVLFGSKGRVSSFISTTEDLEAALNFYRSDPSLRNKRIVQIDVSKIWDRAFIDPVWLAEEYGGGKFCHDGIRWTDVLGYACRHKEVLLEGFVPNHALRVVPGVHPEPARQIRGAAPNLCLVCGGDLVPRTRRRDGARFRGCSRFFSHSCKFTLDGW